MTSKKSEKQITNLLYGISIKNYILIGVVYVCVVMMAICMGAMIYLELFSDPMLVLLCVFMEVFLGIYATVLLTRNLKHSKALKEKFKQLSPLEKEEVKSIAKSFDGKGLGLSEHFIYGFMARVSDYKRARDIIVFEYIPLSQIVSLDTLKSKDREEKEKAFQRKTQAALMSAAKAYMRANRMAHSGIGSNNYNMPVVSGDTTNVSNYICIELRDGLKYRAIGDTVFLEKARRYMDIGIRGCCEKSSRNESV